MSSTISEKLVHDILSVPSASGITNAINRNHDSTFAPLPFCSRSHSGRVNDIGSPESIGRPGFKVTSTLIKLSAADLTPGFYDCQFSAHFLSVLLPMNIAPEEIVHGFQGAVLIRFRYWGVKLKSDGLSWIDANS